MEKHLHVKYLLFLLNFNKTCIFLIDFAKRLTYPISSNSVQWDPELFHADRRTDKTKLLVAFHNFADVPKKLKYILGDCFIVKKALCMCS
jgi:hypothetical protein